MASECEGKKIQTYAKEEELEINPTFADWATKKKKGIDKKQSKTQESAREIDISCINTIVKMPKVVAQMKYVNYD